MVIQSSTGQTYRPRRPRARFAMPMWSSVVTKPWLGPRHISQLRETPSEEALEHTKSELVGSPVWTPLTLLGFWMLTGAS